MASLVKLVVYLFQIAGVLVMFYGFVQQATLPPASQQENCTQAQVDKGTCGEYTRQDELNAELSNRIINIATWLAAGIALVLIGFGINAIFKPNGDEKDRGRTPFDLRGRNNS